jgi:hypothetical protein
MFKYILKMKIQENIFHTYAKQGFEYMKIQFYLNFWHFQVDGTL